MDKKKIELKEIYPIIKEKLESGGTVELPITGTSMLPLLVQGRDTAVIKKKDCYAVGDIIFYRRDDGHFVLHRIVGTDENGFVLCGDNQWVKEYGIENRHIIGAVIIINRNGKAIDVNNNGGYSAYSKVWQSVLPCRKYPIKLMGKMRAVNRKIYSTNNKNG